MKSILTHMCLLGLLVVSLARSQEYAPDSNTVALYHMNELSGSTISDASINGNTGTATGTTAVAGLFGNARQFNGSTDYVILPSSTSLTSFDSSITIEAWIQVYAYGTGGNIITSGYENEYAFAVFPDGKLGVTMAIVNHQLPDGVFFSRSTIPLNTWQHVAFTYDGSTESILINGVVDTSFSTSGNVSGQYRENISIGVYSAYDFQYHDGFFNGIIEELRISNEARTPAELHTTLPAQFGVYYGSTGSSEPTNPGALITIDPLTGAGTLIGPTGIIGDDGPSVRALAIKSTGEMYALSYTASSDLYTVNASTGAGTFVANTGLLHPGDLVFNASDVLYAVDETNILYTVDPVTGARTVVGATGVTLGGLAYDPTDGTVYGSDNNDGIFTLDVTTGAATLVGTTGLGGNTPDILFDQAGNLFGVKKGTGGISDYIAIDKTTGAGTVIGSTGFVAVVGLASRVQSTPSTIQCTEITNMAARCIGGLTKTIQVRVNLLNNIIHAGEPITIAIDEGQFTSTIISNGTHSRANFSVPGWSVGDHSVSLVDPPGCLADKHAICAVSDGIAKADPYWNDDAEWMGYTQEVPQATALLGNYPNPFNPSSNIQYALSEDAHVTLRVYNILGQVVATLVDEPQTAGYKSVVWNGRNDAGTGVASGIYIYRMTAGSFTGTKRMLLLK